MHYFRPTLFEHIRESATRLLSGGFLLTAGSGTSFNVMTATWGAIGYLWERDVALVVVRPQRYTFEFLRREPSFTLSILPVALDEVLNICGALSGRDTDKVKKAGLTPVELSPGVITFEEAVVVIVCKKLYDADFINPDAFVDPTIAETFYPQKDFHHLFIGEMVEVMGRCY